MAFRIFRQILPPGAPRDGCKVLIYGAGDGGEMVLRELKNNAEWNYSPIGFIDDDPLKKGRVIHGLRVFDGNGSLPEICRSREIEEILIAFREIDPMKLKRIKEMGRELDISIKLAQIKIEPLELE
jgi:UDP-GlcNAc:undecaprenyl-phosphate GlcNAc-1-phosphate transferase